MFGPSDDGLTLWRLPGYVGGELDQPVPRDVVAVMTPSDERPAWILDFWVQDAEATAATARRLGGIIVAAPFDAPPFRHALLADPEGAVFSVSQLEVAGP